ncbi:MAG: hypothetical protein RLY97_1451, partial [Pseudomonadota bacterium]
MRQQYIRFIATLLAVLAWPAQVFAATLADPQGSGVLVGAARWVEGTMLG